MKYFIFIKIGQSQPKLSENKNPLPNAEQIVHELQEHFDSQSRHMDVSAFLPVWAEFVINDILEIRKSLNSTQCCNSNANTLNITECYVESGKFCKNYKRSIASLDDEDCLSGIIINF